MKIPYEKHTLKDIETKGQERIVRFKKNTYRAALKYNPEWIKCKNDSIIGHLEFYALSEGWHPYTETGYKSVFIQHSDDDSTNPEKYQDDDSIIQLFYQLLKEDGFVFEKFVQDALF